MSQPEYSLDRSLDATIGVVAPMLGFITSVQEQVEYGLRVLSLVIGIIIGSISLYRLLRKGSEQ